MAKRIKKLFINNIEAIKSFSLLLIIILQIILTLFFILQKKYIGFFQLSFISAFLIGLSVYLNKVEAYFSIFFYTPRSVYVNKQKFRIFLSFFSFILYLLGIFSFRFILLFFEIFKDIIYWFISPLNPNNLKEISVIKEFIVELISKNLFFIMCYFFIFILYISLLKFGYLVKIEKSYKENNLQKFFENDKNNFIDLCFISGYSLIIFFQVYFLIFAIIKKFIFKSFSDWVLNIRKKEFDKYEDIDVVIYNIFKFYLFYSILWVPFFNYSNSSHIVYLVLISCPILFSVTIYIIFYRRIYKGRLYILLIRSIFIISLLSIIIVNFINPSFNPFLGMISNLFENLSYSYDLINVVLIFMNSFIGVTLFIIILNTIFRFK